jgi:hypothetical protein
LPVVTAGVCFLLAVPAVHASEWNQRTDFTFNEPVEVPGRVLNPGTYVFKLTDTTANLDTVQIYTNDQKHLIGTFLTVPDYRLKTPGKPIMTFTERAAGSPEAIKAWFYPGDNFGHRFVYPRSEAMKIAKANNEPVPSMADEEYNSPSMKSGHVRAMQPSGQEIEVIEVFGSAPQTTSSNANGQSGQSYSGNNSSQGNTANRTGR